MPTAETVHKALTLSLTLMSDGATLIFKIFLSPLDPKGSMLRSQLRCFFPNPPGGDEAETFGEFDEDDELSDKVDGLPGSDGTNGKKTSRGSQGSANIGQAGYDKLGRRGGVWVRKPRSSRKGSGGASSSAKSLSEPMFIPSRGIHRLSQL